MFEHEAAGFAFGPVFGYSPSSKSIEHGLLNEFKTHKLSTGRCSSTSDTQRTWHAGPRTMARSRRSTRRSKSSRRPRLFGSLGAKSNAWHAPPCSDSGFKAGACTSELVDAFHGVFVCVRACIDWSRSWSRELLEAGLCSFTKGEAIAKSRQYPGG